MADYQKYYDELNQEQTSAVDQIDGPLLVLAGPGTGKTQLLSLRAASILQKKNIAPENILILTYTNSASKAMKERLARIIGPSGYDVEVDTFHGFANSIIQESEEAANYSGNKIQMTDIEQAQAIKYILDNTAGVSEIKPFRAPYMYLREIVKKISDLKKDGITPSMLHDHLKKNGAGSLEEKYAERLKAFSIVYKRYEDIKSGTVKGIFDERGRYDFDDMILFAIEALKNERALFEEYRSQYQYIMVDEFQDTNGAQLDLLFTLSDPKHPNLCCVGDDDQSIYRFQGASVGNFKVLTQRFPAIKIVKLKDNYRSSSDLIGISEAIIGTIPQDERMGQKKLSAVKSFKDKEIGYTECSAETEELVFLVDKVRELAKKIKLDKSLNEEERSQPYNNIAVLVRRRDDILKIIDAFLCAGIPYATDGKEDIASEKRVRQLLDVLELAHISPEDQNSKDLVLYKVLSADYFEIPLSDILKFIDHVNSEKKKPSGRTVTLLGELIEHFDGSGKIVKFKDMGRLIKAKNVISRLMQDAASRSVHMILMDYIKDAGIYSYILKEYKDNGILRMRELRSMSAFVNMVKASDIAKPAMRLNDFMLEMKTRSDHDLPIQGNMATLTQEGVRVYTAHGSKGLEFHSVIMPFCLHKKNWPITPVPEKIQFPAELLKTKDRSSKPENTKRLSLQDETRLFYVAATRARSNLIFTASPTENSVPSIFLADLDIKKEQCGHPEEGVIAGSMELTSKKDPFIGTSAVLKDMIANMSLNPTRLNTYISCKRKFLYNDVIKLPGPKKRSLVFGNCVHKALEEVYKQYVKSDRFPTFRFFQDAFGLELKFQGVDSILERECLLRMPSLKGWFESAAKKPVMPLGLERKLVVTVGDNIIFTGKYDKVEWYNKDMSAVRIVDYKTGKPDEHLKVIDKCTDLESDECDGYLRQLVCYKLLYERDRKESRGRKVACGELVFTEPLTADIKKQGLSKGDYVSKEVTISDEMVDELELLIKKVHGGIISLKFEKLKERDKDKCSKCDFDRICWCL